MKLSTAVTIRHAAWRTTGPIVTTCRSILARAAMSVPAPRARYALSLLLCGDEEMRGLNRVWRGLDKPTNVLSFPAPGSLAERLELGDIALAFETTEREALAEGKSLSAHVTHLLVHGLLHLVGYDHEIESEAEVMEQREREILARLGIADPYAPQLAEVFHRT